MHKIVFEIENKEIAKDIFSNNDVEIVSKKAEEIRAILYQKGIAISPTNYLAIKYPEEDENTIAFLFKDLKEFKVPLKTIKKMGGI